LKRINWGNWAIRAGALALAFFLWLYAVTEHIYEREIDARLQIEDPSSPSPQERKVIVASLPPPQVRVSVSGKGRDLLQLVGEELLVRMKPEGRAGSVRTYRLTPDLVENRAAQLGVKVEQVIAPRDIEIALDWRAEREVPVKPSIELSVAEHYIQVGETRIEPGVVEISGPSSRIGLIDYVRTEPLVLTEVQGDVDEPLVLLSPPGMRCELDPSQVRVQADVQYLVQDDLSQVQVKVRHRGRRKIEVEPPRVKVKVKGGIDIIANLDPERDLDLFVDFRDFTGEPLPILYEDSPLFEIIEIAPPEVNPVER
jgi:hypothetical protein